MKKRILLSVFVVVLLVQSSGFSALVGSYSGDYDPTSATPPSGQSTWAKAATGTAQLYLPPTAGVPAGSASFYDQTTSGRISITRDHSNIAADWNSNVAATEYEFSTTLRMTAACAQSVATYPVYYFGVGMFEPGGKSIALGWFNDQIMCVDNSAAALYGVGIEWPKKDYRDDLWHDFYVKKYLDNGTMKVSVSIDGVLVQTRNYSAFRANGGAFSGFQIGCPTPSTCNVFLDDVSYNPVPEPATLCLLGAGGFLMRLRSKKA